MEYIGNQQLFWSCFGSKSLETASVGRQPNSQHISTYVHTSDQRKQDLTLLFSNWDPKYMSVLSKWNISNFHLRVSLFYEPDRHTDVYMSPKTLFETVKIKGEKSVSSFCSVFGELTFFEIPWMWKKCNSHGCLTLQDNPSWCHQIALWMRISHLL